MSVRVAGIHELRSVPEDVERTVVVAVPAYNEDRYIGSLVLKLRAGNRQVLVIDDGSTADTAAGAEAAGATGISPPPNQGKTAAVGHAIPQPPHRTCPA